MRDLTRVTCSGPACSSTTQMGDRWEDARWFCSDECREAFHEQQPDRPEIDKPDLDWPSIDQLRSIAEGGGYGEKERRFAKLLLRCREGKTPDDPPPVLEGSIVRVYVQHAQPSQHTGIAYIDGFVVFVLHGDAYEGEHVTVEVEKVRNRDQGGYAWAHPVTLVGEGEDGA